MSADPKLVRDLFLAAADLPASERPAYLSDRCGDPETQAAVERLLAAHEQPAPALLRPAPGVPTADYVPIAEGVGTTIGPYRLMEQIGEGGFGLVFEVAFEGLQRSTRHKSGIAMRFPRIARIRWDKPAGEADTLESLERLLEAAEAGRAG